MKLYMQSVTKFPNHETKRMKSYINHIVVLITFFEHYTDSLILFIMQIFFGKIAAKIFPNMIVAKLDPNLTSRSEEFVSCGEVDSFFC